MPNPTPPAATTARISIGTSVERCCGAAFDTVTADGVAERGAAGNMRSTDCGVIVGACFARSAFTLAASLLMCDSSGVLSASSQCGALMKYSSVLVGIAFSMRSGMMLMPLCTARSTSRSICIEAFALLLKIKTMILEPSSASMMDSAHDAPGVTSRGAIQHLMR